MNEKVAMPGPAPEEDDAALVRHIVSGDRSGFERLMRRYNQRLYRLARAMLRDDAEAEDALQDAYISVFRKLPEFRGDSALGTWLSRLVMNECLGRLRRTARRDNIAPMIAPPRGTEFDTMTIATTEPPDVGAVRAQMRTVLERKLDGLPEAFRTVFVCRCVEELSVDETAACLGLTEATVRSRLFRARSLLRESLAMEIDLAERDAFEFGNARCDRTVVAVLARLPP